MPLPKAKHAEESDLVEKSTLYGGKRPWRILESFTRNLKRHQSFVAMIASSIIIIIIIIITIYIALFLQVSKGALQTTQNLRKGKTV